MFAPGVNIRSGQKLPRNPRQHWVSAVFLKNHSLILFRTCVFDFSKASGGCAATTKTSAPSRTSSGGELSPGVCQCCDEIKITNGEAFENPCPV